MGDTSFGDGYGSGSFDDSFGDEYGSGADATISVENFLSKSVGS